MSEDRNDEANERTSVHDEEMQVPDETMTVEGSLGDETSRDIYDFFRRNRELFHYGSDEDISRVRKSEYQPETIYVYMTVPPDGGWGWVIVVISFICNAIVDGICLTFGRMIPDLSKDLRLDISKVITISSVMSGVYFLVGPVVSAIVNKVGFRPVAMSGGFLSSIGILCGSFCKTWLSITICYGLIAGSGLGMVFAPSNIIVGYYFEKYRALANGIAICGSGFGTLIFAPIYGYLADNYGWKNSLRLQSCLCAVVGFASILFRPLIPVRVAQIKEPEAASVSEIESEQSVELDFASYSQFLPSRPEPAQSDSLSAKWSHGTLVLDPTAEIVQHLKRYRPEEKQSIENCCAKLWKRFCFSCRNASTAEKPAPNGSQRDLNLVLESRPLFRRDIFYPRSVGKLVDNDQSGQDLKRSRTRTSLGADEQVARINLTMSMMHPSRKIKQQPKRSRISSVIVQGFVLLFDVHLFSYPTFWFLVLVCFFFIVGSNIPYMFITSHSEENGMPRGYANWLLSVIGVSNTVFRLIAGLTSFFPRLNPIYLTAAVMSIAGVFTFVNGFAGQSSVTFQYIYCVVFGMGSAYFNTLKQVIFVRCLGLDNLTNAFGITSLIMGLATLIGMPLVGILIDSTGNSNVAFVYAGAAIILSGVLQALVPVCLERQQIKKGQRKREQLSVSLKQANDN